MNRINRWLSLLVAITALGGAQITLAIEADTQTGSQESNESYLSVDLISWDGQTLRTEGGDFVIDSSVEVLDERTLDSHGNLPEKAHVELSFENGTLRRVVLF